MDKEIAWVYSWTNSTISAFWIGDTLQHITALQRVHSSINSCLTDCSKAWIKVFPSMIRLRSSVSFLASFSLVSSLTISSLVESNDVWFKIIRGVSIGEKQNILNQGNTWSTSILVTVWSEGFLYKVAPPELKNLPIM